MAQISETDADNQLQVPNDAKVSCKSFIEEMLDCDDKLKEEAKFLLAQTRAMLADTIQEIMRDESTTTILVKTELDEKFTGRLHWPSGLSRLCASYLGAMSLKWDLVVDGHFAHTVTCPDFYRGELGENAVKFVARFDFPAHLHKGDNCESIYINEYVVFDHGRLLLPTLPLHHQQSKPPRSAVFRLSNKHWKKNIDFDEIRSMPKFLGARSDVNFNHFFQLDEIASLEIKVPVAPLVQTQWGYSYGLIDDDDFDYQRIAKIKENPESTIEVQFSRIVARGDCLYVWEVKDPLVISIDKSKVSN